jgi:hypothetical protein
MKSVKTLAERTCYDARSTRLPIELEPYD